MTWLTTPMPFQHAERGDVDEVEIADNDVLVVGLCNKKKDEEKCVRDLQLFTLVVFESALHRCP